MQSHICPSLLRPLSSSSFFIGKMSVDGVARSLELDDEVQKR